MRPEFLIAYFSFGSVIVPLSIAIAHWKKMPEELKPLGLLLLLSLASDLLSIIFIQYSFNTYLIGNIYMITQFFLLIWLFRIQLSTKRTTTIILLFSGLFCIVNITIFQGPWVFNSVSNVMASLILIGFCLYHFYRLLSDLPIVHIHHLPMLWISFAILTYYGGNFFLFLVKNYLLYGEAGAHKLMWILHNLLNVIKNFLFAIGLWQSYRKLRSSTLLSSVP